MSDIYFTSSFDHDDVCLDLAVDGAASEALADCIRRNIGCFAKTRGIARLDLVP